MPELTPRLGIKKPLGNENVTRESFNENWEIIDQKVATKQEHDDLQNEVATHLADNTPHREAATLHRKNKDENGIYALLEWYRADGTLFKTSELEGESPQYATRRVKFYAEDGQTLVQEVVYILTYDENGELISEVIQT